EELYLIGTGVTDAGLEHLKGSTRLKRLWLAGTRVTSAGVERLKEALPRAEIVWEPTSRPAEGPRLIGPPGPAGTR
ncbi:MAG: hypothetical protein ACYTFI_07605, partial [Planctomycetota bacterium]